MFDFDFIFNFIEDPGSDTLTYGQEYDLSGREYSPDDECESSDDDNSDDGSDN